jgi:EpsD family peptidyl-prolyl cis-trans isomerase
MRAGAWAAAGLAVVLMAGCGPKNPDDAVVATVMGEKITARQLNRELQGARGVNAKDPEVRRAILDQMISRKLLAKAARAEGMDRQPQVLEAKASADEAFDANLYQVAMLARVTPPTPAEAKALVDANPTRFAQRKVYLVAELRTASPPDKALVDALMPTKTLEQAEAVLKARNVPYRRVIDTVDTLRANPKLSQAIAALPAGEPFLLPGAAGLIVGRVQGSRPQPLTGAQAEAVAAQILLAERRAKAARESMATLRKDTVTYAAGYGPPNTKADPK